MKEARGDLWADFPDKDALVITTNGTVQKDGRAVMGAGIALEAAQRFPRLPLDLGKLLREQNKVYVFWDNPSDRIGYDLVTFPTKNAVQNMAEMELIEESCEKLVHYALLFKWKNVVMPRPGCGYGGLLWTDVKPVIEPLLDDRFTVVTW